MVAEKWGIFLCNCDEYKQDHVHCGCSSCNGAIVSKATAFRHRALECQSLPSCWEAGSETLGELEAEDCARETDKTDSSVNDSMDWSTNGDHAGLSKMIFLKIVLTTLKKLKRCQVIGLMTSNIR